VITPRQTRLLRAPHLRAFQRAIAAAARDAGAGAGRSCAVIVPTRAAADELRRTLENFWFTGTGDAVRASAFVLPDLVTRAEWYLGLHERVPEAPRLVTELEREVLFGRAARAAIAEGFTLPFALRSGLVIAMLGFYDELGRRQQSIEAFERLMIGSLEPSADADRGAARMLTQTRFLTAAFRAYERFLEDAGLVDEHGLRRRLLIEGPSPPLAHVIVSVADEVIDRGGLWPADFDLLARLSGLTRVDVVTTEETLATGFHERLHRLLPGIEEARVGAGDGGPVLLAPPGDAESLYQVSRDREEELTGAARRAKAIARASGGDALDRFAVVFQRPLPYVYLARQVCGSAGVPYQAFDALPLAAESYAAALDLLFTVVVSGFTRGAIVAWLRSPHFRFDADGGAVTLDEIAALDAALQQVRFLGGLDRVAALAADLEAGRVASVASAQARAAARAARAIARMGGELASLTDEGAPSAHLGTLASFLRRRERLPARAASWRVRHLRARAAILGAIDALGAAHVQHDDTPRPFAALAASIRRWIEAQTFSPRAGRTGVHLVDAAAARYGDFDEIRLVGLADTDWPEAVPRTVFYPANLLVQLGWPREIARRTGPRAAFLDLIRLPAARVSLSTFTLEDDALVRPSPFLEDLEEAGLPVERSPDEPAGRMFAHEALSEEPLAPEAVSGAAAVWLALRLARTPSGAPMFHGAADPRDPDVYRVSDVERYLQCPFKYFAATVLCIDEEREEEPGLTPQERGLLLHEVLQEFFSEWQQAGRGAITVEHFDEAVAAFARVADERLARLPEADRALERARLLGSAVATGLAERAFEFEIGVAAAVVERLLEYVLEGEFELQGSNGARRVGLRGKTDRIDLLEDGTLRVIDYKLGSAPKLANAIQLPVYGVCAEQRLAGHRGRTWRLGTAGYVAFNERRSFTPLAQPGKPFADAVRQGQERFVSAIEGIERGEFPVRPAEPYRCVYCAYAPVCRKDYVGDE
jgi:RecB family exonuclease